MAHMATKIDARGGPRGKNQMTHMEIEAARGVLGRSTWGFGYRTRRVCVLPLGEASHDAGTASVAVVDLTSAKRRTMLNERAQLKARRMSERPLRGAICTLRGSEIVLDVVRDSASINGVPMTTSNDHKWQGSRGTASSNWTQGTMNSTTKLPRAQPPSQKQN